MANRAVSCRNGPESSGVSHGRSAAVQPRVTSSIRNAGLIKYARRLSYAAVRLRAAAASIVRTRRSPGNAAATSAPVPARNTSQSRAPPRMAARSRSAGDNAAVWSHAATSRKIEKAERSRRVATRIWCTPMGVSPALAGPDQCSITSSSWPTITAMLSDSGRPGSIAGVPRWRGVTSCPRATATASAPSPARGTDIRAPAAICAASACSWASGPSSETRHTRCSVATPRNAPDRIATVTL